MKILLAIFLSATLGFAETAPAPAEGPQSPADGGELVPSETDLSQADVPAPISAEVRLADGSVIKGVPCQRAIQASSGLLGRFSLDLESVGSITFDDRGNGARIAFRNGDILTATLEPDGGSLALETVLGQLSIPLGEVSSIMIAGDAAGVLLYHCTFDSAESIKHPAAGPSGTFLGGEFVPGKKGRALRSPGDIPVAEVDIPKGLLQPCGTIEFWARIEEPLAIYGDRGNPRFFNLWLYEDVLDAGPCSTYLQFTSNDGMGMSGLCGMIYHRAMATDPQMTTHTYGPLLSDPAGWHHYAIIWDKDGLPFSMASDGTPAVATLVLDGQVLRTFGRNQLFKGEGLLGLPSLRGKLAFPVPADRMDAAARRVPFLIDEFKIWSKPVVPTAASTGP